MSALLVEAISQMLELGKLLQELTEKVGWRSVALIAIGGGATALAGNLPSESFGFTKDVVLPGFALACFSIGTLLIMVRIVGGTLSSRPGQGLVEGAAAGAIGSVVGGLLGFGLFDVFEDGLVVLDYPPRFLRLLALAVPAVPVSSLLGLLLDLVHPQLQRHPRIGAGHFGFIAIIVLILTICVIHLNPVYFEEAGATFSDMQTQIAAIFFFLTVFWVVDLRLQPLGAAIGFGVWGIFFTLSRSVLELVPISHWRYENIPIALADKMMITYNFNPEANLFDRATDVGMLSQTSFAGFIAFIHLLWFGLGFLIFARFAQARGRH